MITLEHLNNTIFNDRVDWQSINQELALRNTKCLDLLHEACLIEAYLPVYTGKMNELFWDDLDATSIFTIEAYEAYGHYFIIRKYLDIVGYNPVTDEEVLQVRSRDKDNVYTDKIRELVNFMGTEHFAAEFFKDLMKLTEEPILKKMLKGFYAEEICHSQLAFDLLEKMMKENPEVKKKTLEHALNYQHIGAYVTPKVSPAKDDNLKVVLSFNKKIERLTGKSLSEFIAEQEGRL